jgi:para-nitrobenzyl esterase
MPINLLSHNITARRFRYSKRLTPLLLLTLVMVMPAMAQERVKTANGVLEGAYDKISGIYSFKGIPFAAPPVGDLRWKPPQPVKSWRGVRKADKFGPRAIQLPLFSDMNFRSDGMSEDCLYLNVWTPAISSGKKLPVLVYFFGGGFVAGDGSEPRYDGESMAKNGIVAVTVNYRLGIFGFFADPELTKESPHHASGNYGLLDQHAAIVWVHRNIAAFGGDPSRVTIAGESAGSVSVSAQMASPLSKGLFAGAIGESGSIIGTLSAIPLADAEMNGVKLASELGLGKSPSLAALRKMPAEELLHAAAKAGNVWFNPTVDGYFLSKNPTEIFAAGKQMRVPLLAGVNSEEMSYSSVLGKEQPTVENYRKALQRLYPDKASEAFKLYPASNEAEVKFAAQELASDRFTGYSTWKWIDLATKTGDCPTYYYLYSHPRPPMLVESGNAVSSSVSGAVHSAEIEYAMGNLGSNKVYAWTPEDYKISKMMQAYFVNFIKTGNPNGLGLSPWPEFARGERLIIDANPRPERMDKRRAQYEFLDQFYIKK